MKNIISELRDRNLINNITNEEKLANALKKGYGIYVGFDPSFDSLHLGNYIMIMLLRRFHQAGIKTVAIVGGATGMIGDPSGKSQERNLLDKETLTHNITNVTKQLITYAQSEVLNNYQFYEKMNFLDFLRDVGKSINVNYLLEKEIISSRLATGISFTEFSYNLLQGYDFLQLYKNHQIAIQAGGSDQWGNITTGVEIIRKNMGDDNLACGLTINLLVNKDGKKFGKSEKGAIYLSEKYTSAYEMYQFLINQADDDIAQLLYSLTLISVPDIKQLLNEHEEQKHLRLAQKKLAETVVVDIHGIEKLQQAIAISQALFNGNINALSPDDLEIAFKTIPSVEIKKLPVSLVDFLIEMQIAASKRVARELIINNSLLINGQKINDEQYVLVNKDLLLNQYILVKKGKRNYFLARIIK
ncbi:tyrosine--tRNA ligase [Ureaplasma zalophigenitalium]|uniref:Tyrosine--tRNA ligase n=1 Tax=Ureaplasma zalophigenitalium TaxID=907723 RepID=A0ABT3BNI8_9BACT|nr:tyrosine--tRNA ligase [Ureaplasma zalophigenitalium]MCV3753820.1 tyrosine--tRNA ligase [Ureaplasma zalophigenitalium]